MMILGKLVKWNGEYFLRDLATKQQHHVEVIGDLTPHGFYGFEINENDDAIDIIPAHEALIAYGIQPDTGSFYTGKNEETGEADEAESFFGTCELTGIKGDIVPCMFLGTDGNIVQIQAGKWLVHSLLGKLAGAF